MLRGLNTGRAGKLAAIALIVFLAGAWQPPQRGPSKSASGLPTALEINSILKELSDITGFHIRKQLPFELITRDQVNRYVREQMKDSVKPDEIRAEEATLKMFGFAKPDFDLKKTTIDLLTEQAAAFYDYKRKKLFISDWAAANMRDIALIHELAHALADQNFPIKRFLDKGAEDSEASLARQAVVEGQASWLMLEVSARRTGRSMADEKTAHELLDNNLDSAQDDYPVFNNAPLYLRKTLTFPYTDGGRFQQAVFLHDGGLAFSRVFRDPPVSTAQIMHPVRYFEKTAPVTPSLPKQLKHAKPYVRGEMGELETRILLEQYAGAELADELGPKLRGGAYRIDEMKPDQHLTLVYASEWSDEDSATRYFEAYQKVLRGKSKRIETLAVTANTLSGRSEGGYFKVARNGKRILSQEGFPDPFEPLSEGTRVDNVAGHVTLGALRQ
jgi:hypothetical protein